MSLQGYTQINEEFSVNKYLRLGGGSYGQVYRGFDEKQKRHIAVKHIPRANLSGVPMGELQQVTIMKMLEHPNIMKCYGSHGDRTSYDGIFLFLQLCEKGTLNQLIPQKLPQNTIIHFFKELVDAMAYMNDKKFFHRDLKPENLLITTDNHIKIADFGIARTIQSDPKVTFKKCTPIYSAPQVYLQQIYNNLNEQYNQKCDVFSAGYILYEMLTSEQLNKGVKTAAQLTLFLMNNKKNGGFNIIHPAVTPRWKTLLLRMLAFQANNRPSFAEIKEILTKFQPSNSPSMIGDYYSQEDKQLSEQQYRKVVNLIQLTNNRNNYLLSILKILNKYQQYRSQFVPRIYKIILLYFSITRYCLLAEDGLRLLDTKNEFLLPYCNQSLADVEEKFIPEYKVKLNEFIKKVSSRVNEGKEQMRIFLVNHIIPQMQQFFKKPADNLQRMVIQQFKIRDSSLSKLKQGQYEMDMTYKLGLIRCINNLYHTAAEIEILPIHDLHIYLVCLYTARIDSFINFSPLQAGSFPKKIEQIIEMDRQTLQQKISEEKNKD